MERISHVACHVANGGSECASVSVRVLCAGEGDIEGFESKRDAGEPVACVAWYTSSATRCS